MVKSEEDKERFNLLPVPVFMMDRDGRFIFVNQEALTLYGYTEQEFLSLRLEDLAKDREDAAVHQQVLAYSINHHKKRRILRQHKIKDGRLIDVDVQWTVIKEDGEPYILSCIREITEQQEVLRSYERAVDIMSKVVRNLSCEEC